VSGSASQQASSKDGADGEPSVLSKALSDLLGIAEDPGASSDPVSFGRALAASGQAMAKNPMGVAAANVRLLMGSAAAARAATARAFGLEAAAPAAPAKGDKRFDDPAYSENPFFFWLAQQYLLTGQLVAELLDVAGLEGSDAVKAKMASSIMVDALSPSNNLFGNPAALKRAFETGGKSVLRGAQNFVHDVRHNGGWPAQVDRSGIELGVNTAATRGAVVYRSDLIELIQYSPQTTTVHSVPLLFSPPWINKYYLLDLAPGKSLIEWAVQHGHTVFAISYRNPDATMGDLSFEDYMSQGPLEAVQVVREITGSEQVNLVGLCLGGTLTAIGLAHNARIGDRSVKSATFLNTHTDFTVPGGLGAFTDEKTIAGLEKKMAKKGYLESAEMAHTFDLLRANDLVFAYVINNWLLGNKPPSFDLLAWNSDGTRMPARMHSEYLRTCYLRNEFSRGEFVVAGHKIDPGAIDIDTYVLSAVDDHIVPWVSAYKTTQIFGGKSRFVLSTSGHIAGVVNPPSPKAKHWTNEEVGPDPQKWKAGAALHDETWWEDWSRWIAAQAGRPVSAPTALGSELYPALEAAPGSYVRATA
jgi:polyhydroxyalkanoate synthase subunit PhaC